MKHRMFSVVFSIILLMTACAPLGALFDVSSNEQALTDSTQTATNQAETEETAQNPTIATTSVTETTVSETTTSAVTTAEPEKQTTPFSLSAIPPFSNMPYYEVNNNKPFFTNDEITTQSYEYYPDLDSLGRCGACIACISLDMMPTTEREGIGMVKPSGWHLDKYDFVDGKYLFNRCHLIGYQLTGENANLSNLIR